MALLNSSPANSGSNRKPRRFALLLIVISLAASPAASAQQSPDPELKRLLLEAVNSSESFPDRFEAQVWLTDMSARLARQVPDPQERVEILQHVHYAAGRTDLPPELVLAVIDVESNFDRYAISVAGARGLMQIMPFWLDELNRPDGNLFEIETNLRMGCTILRYYLDMGDEDLASALARYNGSYGRSARYPQKVLGKLSSRWFRQ